MEIKPVGKEDIKEVFEIMKVYRRAAYTENFVKDLVYSKRSLCLKLVKNGKILGVIGAREEGKNSLWLYFVVVKKDERGKGYGRALMEKLLEEAKKHGIKRIALDTPEPGFFEKFGFRSLAELPKWYEEKNQFVMFKRIG